MSMTNRYGHTVDRARLLTAVLRSPVEEPNDSIHSQLQILAKRATIARMAITLAAVSVLLASFLVITLFIGLLLSLDVALIVVGLFMLCMISLSASLVHFIIDVNLSLKALWLELPDAPPGWGSKRAFLFVGSLAHSVKWRAVLAPSRNSCNRGSNAARIRSKRLGK